MADFNAFGIDKHDYAVGIEPADIATDSFNRQTKEIGNFLARKWKVQDQVVCEFGGVCTMVMLLDPQPQQEHCDLFQGILSTQRRQPLPRLFKVHRDPLQQVMAKGWMAFDDIVELRTVKATQFDVGDTHCIVVTLG